MSATAIPDTTVDAPALPSVRALRLRIRTRWRRPTVIPGPLLANVLRGALGITLRQLVCPEGWHDHDCHPCPLYADCAYGQVFAPRPPDDATQLRLQQDLPRPFVIEPPGLDPSTSATPEGLTFRLMLFGTAIDRLPYFISTLDRLGHDGLGRDRVPFDIQEIVAGHPHGDETLFLGGGTTVTLPQRVITTDDLVQAAWPTLPVTEPGPSDARRRVLSKLGLSDPALRDRPFDPSRPRVQVQFVTPLLLKSGSGIDANGRRIPAQEIRDRPPFGVIIRRLRDRLSSLCTFFGEPWRHPDFASLGTEADRVELIQSQTHWLTRDRRSTRTGQSHEISGLIGHATYEFPDEATFAALSPLLRLGELLHIGKHAPWGNGAIRATRITSPRSGGGNPLVRRDHDSTD